MEMLIFFNISFILMQIMLKITSMMQVRVLMVLAIGILTIILSKKWNMNNNITPLVDDLRQIINEARNRVAVNVNAELTLMYWHIGE